MNRTIVLLLASLLVIARPHESHALDYVLPYAFDYPMGQGVSTNWHLGDSIVYRADTGDVTYHASPNGTGYTRWWPPDLASRSGALLGPPVSEESSPTISKAGTILTQSDVTIEGVVVPGSNVVGPRYDGYAIWPFEINDPRVLAIWGPLGMPYSFNYGKILPVGLSEEFLRTDIYSFPLVNLVYVVPEPASSLLVLSCACLLAGVRTSRKTI